jgi:hypothetical protein
MSAVCNILEDFLNEATYLRNDMISAQMGIKIKFD